MKTALACIGARGVDTTTLLTDTTAAALKNADVDFALQYLGEVTPAALDAILGAGLAFMPVTFADQFNGGTTVAELRALGLPAGCTVWLDVESVTALTSTQLQTVINSWTDTVAAAGYMPGLYVGEGCGLTSDELYALHVVRYWKSPSTILDDSGQLAQPTCGYCMYQLWPTVTWGGVAVDLDFVQEDTQGRLPVWVVAD
ncbi:MAG TPA: glycoside hydrolase domain-containing protein [Paraburkholderia sp.]|nr:glycoside hydrolase domain-containing protein [Paraburkholderia sp.]